MPFAIYSKRTRIISRIVHDLSSLLPSESVVEIDNASSFPRSFETRLLGQPVDSLGLKTFDYGNDAIGIEPMTWSSVVGRRERVKRPPKWVAYARRPKMDFPIHANPFGWNADELAASKYEAMLAKNHPYQVLVGEEWLGTDDIDVSDDPESPGTPMSRGYVISEGQCIINPGGRVVTTPFNFFLQKTVAPIGGGLVPPGGGYGRAAIPPGETAEEDDGFFKFNHFAFDAYYLIVTPDLTTGVFAEVRYLEWSEGDWGDAKGSDDGNATGVLGTGATGTSTWVSDPTPEDDPFNGLELNNWQGSITDDEVDFFLRQKVNTTPSNDLPAYPPNAPASVAKTIQLRFINTTEDAFAMESYVLMLRLKNPQHHPEGQNIFFPFPI